MADDHPAEPPIEELPTAERLLDAGMQLMREHFADADNTLGIGHHYISPTQVAARAGMSKGMLYHIWGRAGTKAFDAYVAELAERALFGVTDPDELRAGIDALRSGDVEWDDAVVLLGIEELGGMLDNPERRLTFIQTLSLTAYSGSRAICKSLRANCTRTYEDLAVFYEHAFRIYGRRLRTVAGTGRALTSVDFARAVSCLTEGFAVEGLHTPEVIEADINWSVGLCDRPVSLYSIALLGLVESLTEPIPADPEPR